MKLNISLSLKITFIIITLLMIIIGSLTYINVREQTSFFEKSYEEKAVALAQSLDVSITNQKQLEDEQLLTNYILKFILTNKDVIKININLPKEDKLNVFVSSDSDQKRQESQPKNYDSYRQGKTISIPHHEEDSHTITVITPIELSGQIVGTYEMVLSMDESYAALDVQIQNLIIITVICFIILVISFLLILQKIVVKPIYTLGDAVKKISQGDLDVKINIRSRDEFRLLANTFNQMTIELKQSRDKIQKYSETQDKLLKQKNEFIGQLSHDLKNPLTPLCGLLPTIEKKEKDPKLKKLLHVVNQNVIFMKDLVIKTLQLERLNIPDMQPDLEKINLYNEINNIILEKQLLLDEKKLDFLNNIDKKLYIDADKLRFKELIDNILTNAIKFTDQKGKVIINAEEDIKSTIVSVIDTGKGMTSEQIEHIFDEFYKADPSRHELDSSGLGLTICKRIMQIHNGEIWAKSSGIDKGSTFYLRFPFKNANNNKK